MSQHQVRRIACVGRTFDPAQMTAVGLVHSPQVAPNTVVEELRPGYLWRDKIVRFAEVHVASRDSGQPQAARTP